MNLPNFFGELKRRNVYKVAITYAVVAWLLIQAASILFPTFEAPAWVMKAFVVLLAFGFVMSVMISRGVRSDTGRSEANGGCSGRCGGGVTNLESAKVWHFRR